MKPKAAVFDNSLRTHKIQTKSKEGSGMIFRWASRNSRGTREFKIKHRAAEAKISAGPRKYTRSLQLIPHALLYRLALGDHNDVIL